MKPFKVKKIYRAFFIKNLTTFLIPMLIPLFVMGTLSIFLIQQYIKEQINDDTMNLLQQTNENIELMFNELDSLNLYIVASATEFTNLKNMLKKRWLEPADYKELASLKNFIDSPNIARPYIDSIYIYLENDKGRFLSSTTGGLVEINNYHDQSWFEGFKNHEGDELIWTEARTVFSPYYDGAPLTSKNVITMYRKIPLENDGVIVLNIETNYIKEYLANISSMEGQSLFIVDNNNNVIFDNQKSDLKHSDLEVIFSEPRFFFSAKLEEESFIISKLVSEKYGWTFISISPKDSLYQVPKRLSGIALLLLSLSVISGTALAWYLTKKNANDVRTIISILQAAEQGKALPPLPSRVKDVYSYIVHKILKNFMEHNYLKIFLSEKKYKEQAMEFKALQSQLNPHFLFNTLETINWKAISLTGKPNELNHMLENLADILRYSLDGEDKMVSLQQEIIYTLNYIEIQKVRYKDAFDVIWDYDEDDLKYQVIKLILQPLIENSLQHGFKEKEKCLIKIKIRMSQKLLKISVIDNGKGIKPERLHEIRENLDSSREHTKHIGLSNTYKRLKLTYGHPYGLVLQSKLGWGTAVHLFIPRD